MTPSPHESSKPPARRGFFEAISAAINPPPVPEDDKGPLIAPRGVVVASIMMMVSSLAFLLTGAVGLLTLSAQEQDNRGRYNDQLAECTQTFGGVGTGAVTQQTPTGTLEQICQSLPTPDQIDWTALRTQAVVICVVYLLLGIVIAVAGWLLRTGRAWTRRVLVAGLILTMLPVFLNIPTGLLTLLATLLLLIATVLCYISSGSTYFLRVKLRRHT